MKYIKLHNDKWEDLNKVWVVLEYQTRQNSSGVHLVLEDAYSGEVSHRVVASHQIEWIEDKDW